MQHDRLKHGVMQLQTEERQCEKQLTPMHKPVLQNSEDIINAMFSPLSFMGNGETAESALPPPLELEQPSLLEAASSDALTQLRQLLNEPSPSIEQAPCATVKQKDSQGQVHLLHSNFSTVTTVNAVASRRVHQALPQAVASKPLQTAELPEKCDHLGVTRDCLTKPAGKRTPRVRRYARAKPSKFCHVCARSGDSVQLLACKNVKYGVCRKAVCQKCFAEQGWDWVIAKAHPEEFSCCHCRRDCPENAQCRTYQKTNERRRNRCMRKRMMIEDTLANGGDVEAILRKNELF